MMMHELLYDIIDFCTRISTKSIVQEQLCRQKISQLLNNFRQRAFDHGLSNHDLDVMQYAIIATIDELVCECYPQLRAQWSSDSLQVVAYQNHIAGELFFIKLDAAISVESVNVEVVKVFLICLLLGFKGRFYHQKNKINEYKETLLRFVEQHQQKHPLKKSKKQFKFYQFLIVLLLLFLSVYLLGMMSISVKANILLSHFKQIEQAYDETSQQNH